jgi:hypothetical protein
MGWSETTALRERFGGIREFLKRSCPHWLLGTSYSGWIAAQQREQQRLAPVVVERFRAEMRMLAGLQCFGRWNAFAVDGSDSPCPRTLANQAAMGDKGKPDGIPQVAMTKLLHLRTGLPWSFRVGPGTTSERAQLREMLGDLPQGSLLVADAGSSATNSAATCSSVANTSSGVSAATCICSRNWVIPAKKGPAKKGPAKKGPAT